MSDVQIQEFRDQIQHAAASKSVLSIHGGGSKAWYGNPNTHSKLLTAGFQGIVDYQPEELVITARAGTPLATIEAALAEKNQILAFEPPHFGAQATFGGAIGAGLAGPGRISAGNLRDYVLGTRLMDGQGHDLSFGGKVMKNVAGYDVSRLLPGSLGTFALILEASVKVLPKPAGSASLRCFISEARALKVLADKGKGWPAHSFSTFRARASEIKQRKDALPAGLGKTLTEASSMRAKVPKEPGNKRETS